MRPAMLCGISNPLELLFPARGQVSYVLLTRLPLSIRRIATPDTPFDLHVLCTLPALTLSQDQTLHLKLLRLKSE